jgi:hypothetical protein
VPGLGGASYAASLAALNGLAAMAQARAARACDLHSPPGALGQRTRPALLLWSMRSC